MRGSELNNLTGYILQVDRKVGLYLAVLQIPYILLAPNYDDMCPSARSNTWEGRVYHFVSQSMKILMSIKHQRVLGVFHPSRLDIRNREEVAFREIFLKVRTFTDQQRKKHEENQSRFTCKAIWLSKLTQASLLVKAAYCFVSTHSVGEHNHKKKSGDQAEARCYTSI